MNALTRAASLDDRDLLHCVVSLAGRERQATVELVGHLAELDARKLYLGEGYGSLFAYCTGALRLSEHGAYNRIEAARLCRRLPAVLGLLEEGELNLTTARLLAPHLSPDNFEAVIARARRKSKREVEEVVAGLAPKPDVVASVRRLPSPPPSVPVESGRAERPESEGLAAALPTEVAAPLHKPTIQPLAPERYSLKFTIGQATRQKLVRAQDLLRREIPDGDPAAIFDRALTLLLEDVARRKLALATKPGTEKGKSTKAVSQGSRSRHIPAAVRRAVWLRDGERCAFVAVSGRRCTERASLEFHHREPYAVGGEATVTNISLRCRAHNVHEADLVFGPRRPGLVPGRCATKGSSVHVSESLTRGGDRTPRKQSKRGNSVRATGPAKPWIEPTLGGLRSCGP